MRTVRLGSSRRCSCPGFSNAVALLMKSLQRAVAGLKRHCEALMVG